MPVTIKTNVMKYKSSQGEYKEINAVSDHTAAEQIALIQSAGTTQVGNVNSAGSTQITNINNRATEIENSWPSDYSELTDDVDSLKSAFETNEERINNIDGDVIYRYGNISKTVSGAYGWQNIIAPTISVIGCDKINVKSDSFSVVGTYALRIKVVSSQSATLLDQYIKGNQYNNNYEVNLPSGSYNATITFYANDEAGTAGTAYFNNLIVTAHLIESLAGNLEDATGRLEDIEERFEESVSKNLYHATSYEVGYRASSDTPNPNPDYVAINDYFPVEPGETYTFGWYNSGKVWISAWNPIMVYYNANKAYVGYYQVSSGIQEMPDTAYFIRVSMPKSQYEGENYFQIEKGDTPTDYAPYYDKVILKDSYLDTEYLDTHYESKPIINYITVGLDASDDYSRVQDAIASISNNNETNHFVIYIKEGTYDLAEDFTEDEISGETFVGIKVPDWCTLIGVGDRNKVVLTCELDTPDVNISALNMSNTSGLENLTLISVGCRYTLHDDSAVSNGVKGYKRRLKNCVLKGINNYYDSVYGAGTRENADWVFENCVFDATEVNRSGSGNAPGIAWFTHNNSNFRYPCSIKFINCRFLSSMDNGAVVLRTISTNANDMITYVQFYGCKIGTGTHGLYLREEDAQTYGAGCLYMVSGYGNTNETYSIQVSDGQDYSGNIDFLQ